MGAFTDLMIARKIEKLKDELPAGPAGEPGPKGDKGDKGDPGTAPANVIVTVNHGSNAATPRPAGVAAVYWIGSVTPTNAATYDLFFNTAE